MHCVVSSRWNKKKRRYSWFLFSLWLSGFIFVVWLFPSLLVYIYNFCIIFLYTDIVDSVSLSTFFELAHRSFLPYLSQASDTNYRKNPIVWNKQLITALFTNSYKRQRWREALRMLTLWRKITNKVIKDIRCYESNRKIFFLNNLDYWKTAVISINELHTEYIKLISFKVPPLVYGTAIK